MSAACASRPIPVSDFQRAAAPGWSARAAATWARFPSFEAVYRGAYEPASGGKRSLRLWVAAQGAQLLRLEVAGRTGGTLLTLVTDGHEMLGASARLGEHVRGPARPGWLEALTGWAMEADEVAGLLLADLPSRLSLRLRPAHGTAGSLEDPAHGAETAEEPHLQIAWIGQSRDGARRALIFSGEAIPAGEARVAIEVDGHPVGEIVYAEWLERAGAWIPARLVLKAAEGTLELRLEDLSAGTLRPEAFSLEPPAGSNRVPVPAGGERPDGWDAQPGTSEPARSGDGS